MQNCEIEKALDFLDVMISNKHKSNIVTNNTLMNGLCKKDEIEKAFNFLHINDFQGAEA
jgi:PPR repeat